MDSIFILCQNREKLFISKSKLSSKSLIFNSLIEHHPNVEFFIVYLNVPVDHVNRMKEFMENDNLILTSVENAFKIYLLSRTFEIEGLSINCNDFIMRNTDVANVCKVHDFACQNCERQIQHHCWEIFDKKWNEIFTGEDFIHCTETTIFTFLSRPKYETLTEFHLFQAVYKWALRKYASQESIEMNAVMQSDDFRRGFRLILNQFLPMVRFFAMSEQELENDVIPLNFLNADEREAIRSKVITHIVSALISSVETKRTRVDNSILFKYINRRDLDTIRESRLTPKKTFKCEILVYHDCFLISLNLPIHHFSSNNLRVSLDFHYMSEEIPSKILQLDCDRNGKADLKEFIYLKQNSLSQLFIRFPEEVVVNNIIMANPDRKYFLTEEQRNRLIRRKRKQDRLKWNFLYSDVSLYF